MLYLVIKKMPRNFYRPTNQPTDRPKDSPFHFQQDADATGVTHKKWVTRLTSRLGERVRKEVGYKDAHYLRILIFCLGSSQSIQTKIKIIFQIFIFFSCWCFPLNKLAEKINAWSRHRTVQYRLSKYCNLENII